MSQDIGARKPAQKPVARSAPTHKYAVGLRVFYREGNVSGVYRVTRHLPDGGRGLQYRIRSDTDGQERAVIESLIERA
jgi:hypothetical protein